jgi:hypothetical protein
MILYQFLLSTELDWNTDISEISANIMEEITWRKEEDLLNYHQEKVISIFTMN